MSITRALNRSSQTPATTWMDNVDDTVNWLSGQALGRLQNVAGTNAITATLNETTSFSSWSTDAHGFLVAAANNTGAVTLQLIDESESPTVNLGANLAVKNNEGDALAADDVVSGKAYLFQYDSTDGYIRLFADVPSQAGTGTQTDHQEFTTPGSNTWTKPSNLDSDAVCLVQLWGAGGGGGTDSNAGGGGGGAYMERWFKASEFGATETATVGTGGAAGSAGTNTTFGAHLTGYAGGRGANNGAGAGGGGGQGGIGGDGNFATGGAGGGPKGGAAGAPGEDSQWGGGGAGSTAGDGGDSIYGGGGGSADSGAAAGDSFYGGGGGGGDSGGTGGTSTWAGDGGDDASAGSAPGGGGGRNAAGGDGKIIVITFGKFSS